MRLASVAVLALISSFALVGCGDDGGSISKSGESSATTAADDSGDDSGGGDASDDDREALITQIVGTGGQVDNDQGECVADAVLDGLSADSLDTIRSSDDFDLSAFEDADKEALVQALDDCVDFDDALADFGTGLTSEAGFPLTDDEVECTTKEFASEYSGTGEFFEAISTMTDDESGVRLFEAMGPCISDETAVAFMTTVLSEQDMDQLLAECVAGHIVDDLGTAGLLDALSEFGSTGASDTLEAASSAAGAACADQGLGGGGDVTVPPIGGGLSGN